MKDYADPRMHTAEHILNQTMVRMLGCGRAFRAHIEKKKSKCDYRLDRDPGEVTLQEAERRVNEVIRRELPVLEEFLPRQEAAARFDLGRLPEDAGERIRIVKVGDYDACPCIGSHVANTREIGTLRITSHDHADGVLRLRFKLDATEHRP